jgi:hypothetical protein
MNRQISAKAIQRCLWMGALLLSAVAASAQTQITFQVDMTDAITGIGFNPSNQTVAARGTFDNWASPGFALTNNPNGANPNLWTGTVDDTLDATDVNWQWVTVTNGTTIVAYSSQNDGDNYVQVLPVGGGSLVVPVEFFDDDGPLATNNITFQVDMAEQLQLGTFTTNDTVYCQGSFNGWANTLLLTNNSALNVTNSQGVFTSLPYQGTLTTWATDENAEAEYKFVYNNGANQYEDPTKGNLDISSGNRFLLNQPVDQAQALPLVDYSDEPFSDTVTNNITFVIDMSVQEFVGNFNPSNNTVEIHGDYNGWGGGTTMVNTNASDTNLYYTTIQYIAPADSQRYFKYVIQPGTQWENVSAANAIGGNRWVNLANANANFSDGPVYFSDEGPSTLIDFVTVTNEMVTFTVSMTNANGTGITGSGGGGTLTFDTNNPTSDTVWLNGLNGGLNNSFWTWAQAPFPGGAPGYQMTQIPNTDLFTITLPVNQGQNMDLIYKYSINGYDDEAGTGDNHERWIRSQPNYTMPVDTYASQGATTQTEISFGNLAITNSGKNQIQVSWLGRGGVELQTTTNLSSGVWTSQPLTDGTNLLVAPGGTSSTNYSVGAGNLFYRLVGPQ